MPVRRKSTNWPVRIFLVLMFLVPVAIGAGFSVLSWQHATRLIAQWNADRDGVPITATVFATKIEEIKHSGSGISAGGSQSSSTSYFCHIAVSYPDPGDGEPQRRQFRLEDDGICRRYKAGDLIPARAVPGRPEHTVLEDGRLSPIWLVVTVALSLVFLGGPIYLLLRVRRASGRGRLG